MRVSDHRYTRDRSRIHLAMRFIALEARTRTIKTWTGLSEDRIRKLHRSYLAEGGQGVARHRGKSPQLISFYLRTARARSESALLASFLCLTDTLTSTPLSLPNLPRGELLCDAYSMYCAHASTPLLQFEHAVFLIMSLSSENELSLQRCGDCGALVVADRWALRTPACAVCGGPSERIDRGIDKNS